MKRTPDPPPVRSRRWLLPMLAPVLAAGLLLAGLIVLGRAALDRVRHDDRYTAAFADIDCEPPGGMTRADFLGEVQYLSEQPGRLRLLDEGLASRLADAFARHPWVERVERVELAPPRLVRVQLRYRRPVLAVPHAGQLRTVDRHGVLLPAKAPTEGLPIFPGKASPPKGPAGTAWGDAAVEEAARAFPSQ